MDPKKMKTFTPITINGMTLKNRIAIGPFGTHAAAVDGTPNWRTRHFYEPLAKGGAGFIMVGITQTIKAKTNWYGGTKGTVGTPTFDDDAQIPAWKELIDCLHSYGTKVGIQLSVFGNSALRPMSDIAEEHKKYGKMSNAGTPDLPGPYVPRDIDDLKEISIELGNAARRCKAAGFDCIQLHSAHGSGLLFAGALSPFFNHRDDEYGGSMENRFRLVKEVLAEMRKAVGDDFPIFVRISGSELMGELGNDIDEVCEFIVPFLESCGVDCIDVSAGDPLYNREGCQPQMYLPRGLWFHLSKRIKDVTKLPVIGVGRVNSIEECEKQLQQETCDLTYFARLGMSDPEFTNKYLSGDHRTTAVRQCIGCNAVGCVPCTINFDREDIRSETRNSTALGTVEKVKKVLVIGGGVAGMEAANVLAERGHKVTLFEKNYELGGLIGTFGKLNFTSEFLNIVEYQKTKLADNKVDVRVCHETNAEEVKSMGFDAVVMATGTHFVLPKELQDAPMVMTHADAINRRREFRSYAQWHKKVLIYGFTASELAIELANEGAEVTLMGPGGESSMCAESWMGLDRKHFIRRMLCDINYIRREEHQMRRYDIKVLYNTKVEGVKDGKVLVYNHDYHKALPYDVLIVSGPRKKNDELVEEIKSVVPEFYIIGDLNKTGNIHDAIVSANDIARMI